MVDIITEDLTSGITLAGAVTIASSGKIIETGEMSAITNLTGIAVVANYGTISSDLTAISFRTSGFIENNTGGVVSGGYGIVINGPAGTVVNAGKISGILGGIAIRGAASFTNLASGNISGAVSAVSGTLVNQGTIAADLGNPVLFTAGGTVLNEGSLAQLTSSEAFAVVVAGAVGAVVNQGAISGVYLRAGGAVTNTGSIDAIFVPYSVEVAGGAGQVYNSGLIGGVGLHNGGVVTNEAAGIITGYSNGVALYAGGSLTNDGTVLGIGGLLGNLAPGKLGDSGVTLSAGGNVTNGDMGLIEGNKSGIALGGGSSDAMVVNEGTIIGRYGFQDSSTMNDTIVDDGTITGTSGTAIAFGSGNDLLILGTGSALNGTVIGGSGNDTIEFAADPTISGLNTEFVNIGTFLNDSSDLVLTGTNLLVPSQMFDNSGLITIPGTFQTLGTVENSGTIAGQLTVGGVYDVFFSAAPNAAEIINQTGGLITSTLASAIDALAGSHPVTVVNAGTISDISGYALEFAPNEASLLVLDPDSTITGDVDGGGGTVLQLASGATAGTISGLGSSLTNFASVVVAARADWDLQNATVQSLQIQDFGSLDLTATSGMVNTIAFDGVDANLILGTMAFAGQVDGFYPSDTIDLTGMSFSAGGQIKLAVGNILMVVENGATTSIQLNPDQSFAGDYFHLSSGGLNGTDVTETGVACFLAGTRIAVQSGEIPVEDLCIGDEILTASGTMKAVKWIGRRRYRAPPPDDSDVIPVLIKAGALADGMPHTDLYLSPAHAVLVDGVLAPAGALVNGASVRFCEDFDEIAYFHIEMESHELVLANGAPAETFIDQDSRKMFENAEEFFRLYPSGASTSYILVAPRLEGGPELDRLRRKVALRAGVLLDQAKGEIIGFLETAERGLISGWAYAPTAPHMPVSLDILNRGALLARTVANIPRPDVKAAGFGHGRCGFSIKLPAPLPALMRHEISVRVAGSGQILVGSPTVIDPAIAQELQATGGLQAVIDQAAKGLASPASFGEALVAAGQKLMVSGAAKPATKITTSNVLFLDENWPTPALDAGSNAVLSHVAAFQALGFSVAFCATSGAPRTAAAQDGVRRLQSRGVTCFGQDGKTVETVLRCFDTLKFVYLHRLAAASAYAGLVRRYVPRAKLIYAVADLHHLRLARQAAVTDRPDLTSRAKTVHDAEFWAMRMADCVITHSSFEADYLAARLPQANIALLPWAVEAIEFPPNTRTRTDIAFLGGAGHAPNLDAVKYLAGEIMPAVWQKHPALKCRVFGAGWMGPAINKLDPRMIFEGHQPNLRAALQQVKLTVAPMRFGAGLKGKVLESLAAGTPCVMSRIAAEGMPLDAAFQIAIADGPMMADAILAVYGDRKNQRVLIEAGLDMIRTHFTQENVNEALAATLRGGRGAHVKAAGKHAPSRRAQSGIIRGLGRLPQTC